MINSKHTCNIPKEIPAGTEFAKLRGGGSSYRCTKWKDDRSGVLCMYYAFDGHEKRIPLHEIKSAICTIKTTGTFTRGDYIGGQDCSFSVIGRVLEKLVGAKYVVQKGFFLD